jgi:hypothetical protein
MAAAAELATGAHRCRLRGTKGASIQAYTPPVPGQRVLCLDEMGPVSAKTSPGEVWRCGPGRAPLTPADGRRGRVWGLGALEPATGLATTVGSPRRESASLVPLLEPVLRPYPARQWRRIADHWTTQVSRETQTALLAWPELQLMWLPT